LFYLD